MKRSRLLIATGYCLALLLLVLPLLEPVVTLLPPRPGQVGWRLQAFGALSQSLLLPLLGGTVAVGTAVLLDHRRVVRVLAGVAFGAALLLAAAMGLFVLDFIEYGGVIERGMRRYFRVAGAVYLLAFILATAFLAWIGAVSWRAARRPRHRRRRSSRDPESYVLRPGPGERPDPE